jgi:hypothetical protein
MFLNLLVTLLTLGTDSSYSTDSSDSLALSVNYFLNWLIKSTPGIGRSAEARGGHERPGHLPRGAQRKRKPLLKRDRK